MRLRMLLRAGVRVLALHIRTATYAFGARRPPAVHTRDPENPAQLKECRGVLSKREHEFTCLRVQLLAFVDHA